MSDDTERAAVLAWLDARIAATETLRSSCTMVSSRVRWRWEVAELTSVRAAIARGEHVTGKDEG